MDVQVFNEKYSRTIDIYELNNVTLVKQKILSRSMLSLLFIGDEEDINQELEKLKEYVKSISVQHLLNK